MLYRSPQRLANQCGFTLVELVTVMLLLAILSVGTVSFLNNAVEGFRSGTERGELSAKVRQSVQHLSHALREALPNSIRVTADGACLEFIPILNSSVYLSAPFGMQATNMQSVPFDAAVGVANWRVAIVPTTNAYNLNNPGPISPTATLNPADAENIVTVDFSASHQFSAASPQQRYFAVTTPVSYCLDNQTLYRYQNYGYSSSQPDSTTLPGSLPNRSKIVSQIESTLPLFVLTIPALTRNAGISLEFTVATPGDALDINHTVQIRNQI